MEKYRPIEPVIEIGQDVSATLSEQIASLRTLRHLSNDIDSGSKGLPPKTRRDSGRNGLYPSQMSRGK